MVFKTKVLHFKVENTPIKDKNGKGRFKKMLKFLVVGKRKLFVAKLSFEEFKVVFFTAERLVSFGSTNFEEISCTFCTLWSKKVRF